MQRRDFFRNAALTTAGFYLSPFTGESRTPVSEWDGKPSSDDWLYLGSNENPYGPSKAMLKAMRASLTDGNRYGMKHALPLREQLATRHGVTADNILLGAGSSEILGLTTLLALQHGGELLTCNPTFRIWMEMANALGGVLNSQALRPDKTFDLNLLDKTAGANTRLIYVCNPNNPTGTKLPHGELKTYLEATTTRHFVLLDEVYQDFIAATDPSFAKMAAANQNLVIARSFSKLYGLAGMRIGYAIGHPATLAKMAARQAWPGNSLTQVSLAAATAALSDQPFADFYLAKNRAAMAVLTAALQRRNIAYIPSHTNFLYFKADRLPTDFIPQMEKRKVTVREIKETDGRWCRISIGTEAEMEAFVQRMDGLLA
jgi:histidinol-phosphate aminotransferase